MLKLNDQTRARLKAAGAIQCDADGEEVFAGLTPSESAFVLSCGQEAPSARDPGDAFLFHQLKHRHLATRLDQIMHRNDSVKPLPLPRHWPNWGD